MTFPSSQALIKAIILTVVIGVIGYFLFPIFGLDQAQTSFALGISLGTLLGAILAAVEFKGAEPGTDRGALKSIFVGNLAFRASPNDLRELFATYGEVNSVRIMTDRVTRRPRGFGFVEMYEKDALKAINALNDKEFMGRPLRVNEGNERRPRDED